MREFGVVSDFAFYLITCVSQTDLLAKLITAKYNTVRLKSLAAIDPSVCYVSIV
mgnify:CR=1 FL=1